MTRPRPYHYPHRNPVVWWASYSPPRPSTGQADGEFSPAPSAPILSDVGAWLKKAALDLDTHEAVKQSLTPQQEADILTRTNASWNRTLPGYTPSSPPIAVIPSKSSRIAQDYRAGHDHALISVVGWAVVVITIVALLVAIKFG